MNDGYSCRDRSGWTAEVIWELQSGASVLNRLDKISLLMPTGRKSNNHSLCICAAGIVAHSELNSVVVLTYESCWSKRDGGRNPAKV